VNGDWKMMTYRSYYENVRLAAKGFIKVTSDKFCPVQVAGYKSVISCHIVHVTSFCLL